MNIIIFGSTGRSGKQVVQQALDAGYFVTAVARNPSKLHITQPHLTILQDAVISALGSDDTKPTMLFSEGMYHIITAMRKYSVKRVMCISASAVETSPK